MEGTSSRPETRRQEEQGEPAALAGAGIIFAIIIVGLPWMLPSCLRQVKRYLNYKKRTETLEASLDVLIPPSKEKRDAAMADAFEGASTHEELREATFNGALALLHRYFAGKTNQEWTSCGPLASPIKTDNDIAISANDTYLFEVREMETAMFGPRKRYTHTFVLAINAEPSDDEAVWQAVKDRLEDERVKWVTRERGCRFALVFRKEVRFFYSRFPRWATHDCQSASWFAKR